MPLGTPTFAECISKLQTQGYTHAQAKAACQLDENIGKDVVSGDTSQKQKAIIRSVKETNGGGSWGISEKELLIGLVVIKLSQTPEGMRMLREIAVQGIRTLGDSMEALAKASVGNPVSAWANPYLLSLVYERVGLVDSARMTEYRIGLNLMSGVKMADEILETLSSFKPFSKPEPSEFPKEIHYGDKTLVVEKVGFVASEKKKKG